jgi:hypothetical protein
LAKAGPFTTYANRIHAEIEVMSVIQNLDRTTNWIVAAVKPRVDNQSLRGAQETIRYLQAQYQMADEN